MPRQGRIDYPGALHHVIVRGIERSVIFKTEHDKQDFLKRLSCHIEGAQARCYAFALMSNHIHLLLQTGTTPLSSIMQSVQTGYAVSYNLRHRRAGKLYQNRFKSIVCDKDEYLQALVRYIHLNPVKARMVKDLGSLAAYPWTSHSIYMGHTQNKWIEAEEVLVSFGRTEAKARQAYLQFMQDGLEAEESFDLDGGGLVRSLGGYWEALKKTKNKKRKKEAVDERILGSGDFVEKVLEATEQQESTASKLQREGWDFEKIKAKVAGIFGLAPEQLECRSKGNDISRGRALLCKWMKAELGVSNRDIAERLGISNPAVSQMIKRGADVERKLGITFDGKFNT